MSRQRIVGGNWKMNLNVASAVQLANDLKSICFNDQTEVVVFPSFLHVPAVTAALSGSSINVGVQDFSQYPDGAYTGEVSLAQLKDVGCSWVLVGHSERRHVIGECDATVNAKTLAALEAGLKVILCIGETLEQREAGQTDAINAGQLALGLAGVTAEQMSNIVIAYEPVWAIGTGKTATPADAQAAHARIREFVAALYNTNVADAVQIQYGGSMKPGNALELLTEKDIDGGLIGGASLKASDFVDIVNA